MSSKVIFVSLNILGFYQFFVPVSPSEASPWYYATLGDNLSRNGQNLLFKNFIH